MGTPKFQWFVKSVVGLPSEEYPVVDVGKKSWAVAVTMKNNKNSHKSRKGGSLWTTLVLGYSHQVIDALSGDLVVPLSIESLLPPLPTLTPLS